MKLHQSASVLASLCLAAPLAHAGDIQVVVEATVFSNSMTGPLAGANAGDPVTVTFDVAASGVDLAPGQFTNYAIDTPSITILAGGGVVNGTSFSQNFGIVNDFPVTDSLRIDFAPIGGGYAIEMVGSNSPGTMLSSTDINASFGTYPGSDFDSINFMSVQGGGGMLDLSLTSISIGVVIPDLTIGCDPANDHHEGDYAKLDSSAFGSGVGSDLHLECIDGPMDEFGFVLVSAGGSGSLPIFEGVLCLDAPQGRYNVQVATNQGLPQLNSLGQFDAAGVLQNLAGTSATGSGFDVPLELPFSPPGQAILSGDTYAFQVWYRDLDAGGGSSANFSNMIVATFP